MEVRGVEPRSVEISASASPSAADSEHSGHQDSVGKRLGALVGVGLSPPVPTSRRRHPAKRRPTPGDRKLLGWTSCQLSSQCEVIFGTYVVSGLLTRLRTPARFRRFNSRRRSQFTPIWVRTKCTASSIAWKGDSRVSARPLLVDSTPPTLGLVHLPLLLTGPDLVALVVLAGTFAEAELYLCYSAFEIHSDRDEG